MFEPWPWWVAGPLIGLAVPLMLLVGGKNLGISSSFRHLCAAGFGAEMADAAWLAGVETVRGWTCITLSRARAAASTSSIIWFACVARTTVPFTEARS